MSVIGAMPVRGEVEPGDAGEDRAARGEAVVAVQLGRVDRPARDVARHRQRAERQAATGGGGRVGDGEAVVRERQQAGGRVGRVAHAGELEGGVGGRARLVARARPAASRPTAPPVPPRRRRRARASAPDSAAQSWGAAAEASGGSGGAEQGGGARAAARRRVMRNEFDTCPHVLPAVHTGGPTSRAGRPRARRRPRRHASTRCSRSCSATVGVDVGGQRADDVADGEGRALLGGERRVLVGAEPDVGARHRRVAVVHAERLEAEVGDRPALRVDADDPRERRSAPAGTGRPWLP